MHRILESTLQNSPKQMRFSRGIWTREPEKKRGTEKRIILFCKTTRKESCIYLPVRSREAFIRGSDRTNIRRKRTQEKILDGSSDGGGHILNQLDREAENRLASPHRRFP